MNEEGGAHRARPYAAAGRPAHGLPFVKPGRSRDHVARVREGRSQPHFLYPSLYFCGPGRDSPRSPRRDARVVVRRVQREFLIRRASTSPGADGAFGTAPSQRRVRRASDGPSAHRGAISRRPLPVLTRIMKHDVLVTLLIAGSRTSAAGERGPVATAATITASFSTHYTIFRDPAAWSAHGRDRGDAMKRILIAGAIATVVFHLFVVHPRGAGELRDIRANRQIVVDRAVGQIGYLGLPRATRR